MPVTTLHNNKMFRLCLQREIGMISLINQSLDAVSSVTSRAPSPPNIRHVPRAFSSISVISLLHTCIAGIDHLYLVYLLQYLSLIILKHVFGIDNPRQLYNNYYSTLNGTLVFL